MVNKRMTIRSGQSRILVALEKLPSTSDYVSLLLLFAFALTICATLWAEFQGWAQVIIMFPFLLASTGAVYLMIANTARWVRFMLVVRDKHEIEVFRSLTELAIHGDLSRPNDDVREVIERVRLGELVFNSRCAREAAVHLSDSLGRIAARRAFLESLDAS